MIVIVKSIHPSTEIFRAVPLAGATRTVCCNFEPEILVGGLLQCDYLLFDIESQPPSDQPFPTWPLLESYDGILQSVIFHSSAKKFPDKVAKEFSRGILLHDTHIRNIVTMGRTMSPQCGASAGGKGRGSAVI